MTISVGSFILLLCSVITGLIVEAIKKMFVISKPNILAAIVSIVVGIAVSVGYIMLTGTAFSTTVVLYIISIVVLSWLCAMLGYDKVIQTISQIGR
jgi:hypothetical protein